MPAPPPGLLRRGAIGIWFCAIGALGLLQFYMRAACQRTSCGGSFAADTIAWLWLAGSVVVALAGIAILVRAVRQ